MKGAFPLVPRRHFSVRFRSEDRLARRLDIRRPCLSEINICFPVPVSIVSRIPHVAICKPLNVSNYERATAVAYYYIPKLKLRHQHHNASPVTTPL